MLPSFSYLPNRVKDEFLQLSGLDQPTEQRQYDIREHTDMVYINLLMRTWFQGQI